MTGDEMLHDFQYKEGIFLVGEASHDDDVAGAELWSAGIPESLQMDAVVEQHAFCADALAKVELHGIVGAAGSHIGQGPVQKVGCLVANPVCYPANQAVADAFSDSHVGVDDESGSGRASLPLVSQMTPVLGMPWICTMSYSSFSSNCCHSRIRWKRLPAFRR